MPPSATPTRHPRASKAAPRVTAAPHDACSDAPSAVGTGADLAADEAPTTTDREFSPAVIARTLRAVADELERDPSLARRVAAAAGETSPARRSPNAPTRGEGRPSADRDEGRRGREGSQAPASGRRFRPRLVTGTPPELGTGIPDPFALVQRLGAAGLRAALAELRLGTLRAIMREHRLDPTGRLAHQNDADRLRAVILEAVGAR